MAHLKNTTQWSFQNLLLLLNAVCDVEGAYVCHGVHVEVREQLCRIGSIFLPSRVLSDLFGKCTYPLNHFTSHNSMTFNID